MISSMNLVFVLALPLLSGALLFKILLRETNTGPGLAVFVSYGLGMGLLAHCMLWMAFFRIPYDMAMITAGLLIIISILWICLVKVFKVRWSPVSGNLFISRSRDQNAGLMIFWGAITLMTLFYIWVRLFIVPVTGWDTLATILFKAKVFFFRRSLDDLSRLPHSTYPLQMSFAVTWLSLVLDRWNEQMTAGSIFFGYILSFLGGAWFFLKRMGVSRSWTAMFIGFVISSNFFLVHFSGFYGDFPQAYYNFFVFACLVLWVQERRSAWLYLAAVLSGMGAFIKLEGLLYSGIHCLTVFVMLWRSSGSRSWRTIAAKMGIFLGILAVWIVPFLVYKQLVLPPLPVTDQNFNFSMIRPEFSIGKFGMMVWVLWADLLFSGNWSLITVIFFLTLCMVPLERYRQRPELGMILFSLGIFLTMVIAGFSSTRFYYDVIDAHDPMSRILMHFFLLIPLFIVLVLGRMENPAHDRSNGPFRGGGSCAG